MAAKSSLNFVELHVEKFLLGLSVLFVLGLGVYFFAVDPNKVEYNGQRVSSNGIDDLIAERAQELKVAIDRAKIEIPAVPTYANKLQEQFSGGIFAPDPNGGPALTKALPLAAALGNPLPPLPGDVVDKAAPKVTVIVPLKPRTAPALRTGISLVERRQLEISPPTVSGGGVTSSTDAETVERSWVSGAVYFPRDAQRREMTAAGYEGYRAKVYIVGVDVQRQVMTASGEFSDWEDVAPSMAMPRVDVPAAVTDSATGELLNQSELDEKLETVKASQEIIMQPEFYAVKAGDSWVVPPLPGYEDVEEEEPGGGGVPPAEPPTQTPSPRPPTPPPGGAGGPPAPGPGGYGGQPQPPPAPTAQPKVSAEEKQKVLKDLRDAERALAAKDKGAAISAAQAVIGSSAATAAQKKRAERIKAEAEKIKEPAPTGATPEKRRFVEDPAGAEHDPAIWFHDDSVEPGKTYRYRLRVKLWNRYLGKPAAVTDPKQADQVVLSGDWSLPSEPVRVAPKTHFFLRGQKAGDVPAAIMDVFTWHDGTWHKEGFTVQVGDTIGEMKEVKTGVDETGRPTKTTVDFSTGAIVLDIRPDDTIWSRRSAGKGEFAYSEAKSLVLVYLDPADGQVKQRIDRVDRADRVYKRLKAGSE